MPGTKKRTPKEMRYAYGVVETALAQVFGANPSTQKGALRGRIQHLRRLGLPSSGPGRGKVIEYTDAQIWAWLIALELEEFGLDPALIVNMVRGAWRHLLKAIKTARANPDDDVLLIVHPRFMSGGWSGNPQLDPAFFDHVKLSDIEQLLTLYREKGQRGSIFNLSARLRSLDQALARFAGEGTLTADAGVIKAKARVE
jgi:hypothetical protein